MAMRALSPIDTTPEVTVTDELSSSARLCHSCYTTWASRSTRSRAATTNIIPLPLWAPLTADTLPGKSNGSMQNELQDQIKDFLLDDPN